MTWKRTIRTGSSERFLATREGRDVAAVDLHYLPDGAVAGTVTLFKEAGWSEQEIPALLRSIEHRERLTRKHSMSVGEIELVEVSTWYDRRVYSPWRIGVRPYRIVVAAISHEDYG